MHAGDNSQKPYLWNFLQDLQAAQWVESLPSLAAYISVGKALQMSGALGALSCSFALRALSIFPPGWDGPIWRQWLHNTDTHLAYTQTHTYTQINLLEREYVCWITCIPFYMTMTISIIFQGSWNLKFSATENLDGYRRYLKIILLECCEGPSKAHMETRSTMNATSLQILI